MNDPHCQLCFDSIPEGADLCSGCEDTMAEFYDAQSDFDFRDDDHMSDSEADADVLRSAGMGTDEDYGIFDEDWFSDL